VWDIYRSNRFVRSVRVVTFKDVNVEELNKSDILLPCSPLLRTRRASTKREGTMRTCPGRATLSSMNSAAAPPPYPPSSRDPGPRPPLPPPRRRARTSRELNFVPLTPPDRASIGCSTRRSFGTGLRHAAVTPAKLRRLRGLAGEFLMDHQVPHRDVRLDVIAIHAQVDDTFAR